MTHPDVDADLPALFNVLDASSTPVVAVDSAGVIKYVNRQAVADFGYAEDELLGQTVEILVPKTSVTRHEQVRAAYAREPRARPMGTGLDLALRHRDGSTFPVEISLTPLPTDHGMWVLARIVDISERRTTERRLLALSRERLALAELNAAILRVQTAEELFAEACRVVSVGGAEYAAGVWIGRRTSTGGFEIVAAAGDVGPVGDADADVLSDLPAVADVVDRAARWLCGDLVAQTSGPWRAWAVAHGAVAAVSLPIRRAGHPVAAFTVHSSRADLLDEEFVSILVTMADNLSFALDRYEAHERVQRLNAQRVELLSRLITAQEQERARIAGDVHDHSIQSLAAIDLRLGLLRTRLDGVDPELASSVDDLHVGLAEVMSGLRHLLFDLEVADPSVCLVDQLQDALDHIFADEPLRARIVVGHAPDGDPTGAAAVDLPPDLRMQALRICKEALTNVRRHAQAQSVTITLTTVDGGMEIAVSDDGVGPSVDAATLQSPHGHHGVDGMRGRAEASGGWFRIERAGGLTTVRFWLPLDHTQLGPI